MPQLNLSKLSGQELRQRLDSSRARGDAKLAYEILREMSLRREAAGDRRKLAKRRAEPHLVSVDLGDPMDHGDEDEVPPMPNWQPPAEKAKAMAAADAYDEPAYDEPAYDPPPEPEPEIVTPPPPKRFQADDEPLTLHAPQESRSARRRKADLDLRMERDLPPPPVRRPRRALPISVGFLLGGVAGLGLGWTVSGRVDPWGVLPAPGPAAVAQAPAKLDIAVASADTPPPPAPPLDVLPTDTVPPEALAPAAEVPAADAPVAELAPAAPPPGPSEVVKIDTTPPPAATDACAAKAMPADRAICETPELQKLQSRLQQAYAEALEAHEDRATLRQRQLAWRDARNDIADPERLARLYEQRIRKLEAATAAARGEQQAALR